MSKTAGVLSEAGAAYHSRALEFTSGESCPVVGNRRIVHQLAPIVRVVKLLHVLRIAVGCRCLGGCCVVWSSPRGRWWVLLWFL